MFRCFTGCDQTSFFLNRGKYCAWDTNMAFKEVEESFAVLKRTPPSVEEMHQHMPTIERFGVIMYDKTSSCDRVDDARQKLFTHKGRAIELIPPTSAALFQHAKELYIGPHIYGAKSFYGTQSCQTHQTGDGQNELQAYGNLSGQLYLRLVNFARK
ncbi:hypothetical protein HOLleu_42379 [Holothuria leucospilota]|uniref:Uncharacterized protein n=1 Tax=Holothuria leucospilota TaxID=206669 RepID=A0A9Q0YAL0_HOLLE|nr:hypothetical protein HOLleu_42379 [Holothuria leucospilota]